MSIAVISALVNTSNNRCFYWSDYLIYLLKVRKLFPLAFFFFFFFLWGKFNENASFLTDNVENLGASPKEHTLTRACKYVYVCAFACVSLHVHGGVCVFVCMLLYKC